MIKPERLRPGDTIGIVSPSAGLGPLFPHRMAAGARMLESLGYRVRFGEHALNAAGYVSGTAAERVADIHAMFRDPEIRAIVATIGGDHSCHLLPLLEFDVIQANPKIFMGYSDITVLTVAIWRATGLVTFNGPSLMTEIAEYPTMPAYSRAAMLRALTSPEPIGAVTPSGWWTEEILDWGDPANRTRERTTAPAAWTWLRGGSGEGRLIGGCLESLQHLRGTPWWPDLGDWEDAILFVETSEEKPSPETVDAILMDYENMGVLARIRGLLVGRPMFYDAGERQALRGIFLARTARFGFPVVADMDFGHTAPMLTLPLGCRARIDGDQQRFAIIEAAVT